MYIRKWLTRAGLVVSLALCLSQIAQGQQAVGPSMGQNMEQMRFEAVPGLPTCAVNAVLTGDPTQGSSILLAKMETGCVVPWHWHTPNEHLMVVSGVLEMQMQDAEPFTLKAGGFALMPSRHVHQGRCTDACVLFVYSDTAFDLHYVDEEGKEISPAEALEAVGETTVTPPQ